MTNKYDFNKNDGVEVLNFFYPAITVFISSLQLIEEDLIKYKLPSDDVKKILDKTEELEFIDEFANIYSLFLKFNENFKMKTFKADNANTLEHVIDLYPNFFQAETICSAINYWVEKSFDNVQAKGSVLTKKEIEEEILDDCLQFLESFESLSSKNGFIDKGDFSLFESLKECELFEDIEDGSQILIALMENKVLKKDGEKSKEASKEFIEAYEKINKVFILSSFILFWNETEEEYSILDDDE